MAKSDADGAPFWRDVGDGFAASDGVNDVCGGDSGGAQPEHAFLAFCQRSVHEPGADVGDEYGEFSFAGVKAERFEVDAGERLGCGVSGVARLAPERDHGGHTRELSIALFQKMLISNIAHGREPRHVDVDGFFLRLPIQIPVGAARARVDDRDVHAAHLSDEGLELGHRALRRGRVERPRVAFPGHARPDGFEVIAVARGDADDAAATAELVRDGRADSLAGSYYDDFLFLAHFRAVSLWRGVGSAGLAFCHFFEEAYRKQHRAQKGGDGKNGASHHEEPHLPAQFRVGQDGVALFGRHSLL